MLNRSWKCLVVTTGALGIVGSGLLGAGAGTALAGSSGQQINYYSHDAYSQCTTGTNQNGDRIGSCTSLRQGSNPDQGHFWVGRANIIWYRTDNSTVQSSCSVPKAQNDDFFDCYEPS
jgi:hypothetical protein